MFRRIVMFAGFMLALPLAAQAQSSTGLYLGVGAGFNKMQEEDVDARLTAGSQSIDVPGELLTDVGPSVSVTFGNRFRSGLRVEGEWSYLSNHIKGESGLSGEDFGTGTEKKN